MDVSCRKRRRSSIDREREEKAKEIEVGIWQHTIMIRCCEVKAVRPGETFHISSLARSSSLATTGVSIPFEWLSSTVLRSVLSL